VLDGRNSLKKKMELMEAESETEEVKTPRFPKAVPFILVNIFLERYSGKGTSGDFYNIISSLQISI
jgi:hypothetical protein